MGEAGEPEAEAREPIETSANFQRCYGCGPENPKGLGLRFQRDPEAGRVVASWSPPPHFAGYKSMAHGGVIATLLDEAMGWALWGLEGKFGVTQGLELRFQRPLRVERQATVLGWVEALEGRDATLRAEVRDARGRLVASGKGAFRLIGGEKVRDA